MHITFLRHATAEDHQLAKPDSERSLIPKGIKQTLRVAHFCRQNQLLPQHLYASPLLRAQQTARYLQENLPCCPEIETVKWLTPETSPQNLIAHLEKLALLGLDEVWLVGHEPSFSETIGQLLMSNPENFNIKKASLTRLNVDFSDQQSTTLLWSIPCALMPN